MAIKMQFFFGVRLKTAGDRRWPQERPQATAGDTTGRALSCHHRQKTCRLAAVAWKKCILPMSADSTDIQFNITLLRFYIISRYKPVRNIPNTNCTEPVVFLQSPAVACHLLWSPVIYRHTASLPHKWSKTRKFSLRNLLPDISINLRKFSNISPLFPIPNSPNLSTHLAALQQ